jgi:hypothetical protein
MLEVVKKVIGVISLIVAVLMAIVTSYLWATKGCVILN